jgi:acyl-CoA synthetase (AMP-forming)/AMP-acid ligase II
MLGNEIEYVELFFACAKLGALITLVNYGYSESELHSVLSSCDVSVLVIVPGFDRYDYTPWLPQLKLGIASLQHVVIVQGSSSLAEYGIDYEEVVSAGTRDTLDLMAIEKTLSSYDVLNLQFTSGSTGSPKASALTHRSIYNAGRFIGHTMYLNSSDRICLPVPLFHSFGLIIGLATVAAHGASIILPDNKFNIEATIACIPKYQCTGLYGVTTMFVAEMAHPNFGQYDMSSLRFAILAGSAVPEALMRKVWAAFGITQTYTNWGLTESASICTMTKDTDTIAQRTLTSGRLFPGFSTKTVHPGTNLIVPLGQRGEIVLRGYGIQACYYGNVAKTAEAHMISPDDGLEWFHTGDEGFIDPDGFFIGRIKDMIIRGGENMAPLEIEDRIMAHPAVTQSAVIVVPDEKYGEQIAAFVEASGSAPVPSDQELRAWVGQTLAKFKAPKYVFWLGSCKEFRVWPKTASGKLRKPDLRNVATKIMERRAGQGRIMAML